MMPTPATMTAVINEHLKYEAAGDAHGAVSMYTDDVQHDVVGSPMGVLTGPDAAQGFYEHLISDLDLRHMDVAREWFGEDFAVMEHAVDANVTGSFMGIDGHGRAVHFPHAPRLGVPRRQDLPRERVARRWGHRRPARRVIPGLDAFTAGGCLLPRGYGTP